MSSDSEDDCYGNIAQKLQSIKNKYQDDKINTTSLLDSSVNSATPKQIDQIFEIEDNSDKNDCEVVKEDSDVEEMSLDAIIAKNSKKRAARSWKRYADISVDNILPTRSRKKTRASKKTNDSIVDSPADTNSLINTPSVTVDAPIRGKGRGKGRQRGRRRGNANKTASNVNTSAIACHISPTVSTTTVATNTTAVNTVNTPEIPAEIDRSSMMLNAARSLRGRRGRTSTPRRRRQVSYLHFGQSRNQSASCPTYNIGNFEAYPDECYNQPLFNNQSAKTNDVIIIEDPENDLLDENEELSVKVYWQSREHVKFMIRRFQKLTQIFDFFAQREKVSHDKLLFTYNDKILKIDDTPDSITYSIVKFIEGGIINQSVSKIVQNDRSTAKGGLKLKFQCQNLKKPFEITVQPNDKMAVAMMMCAEHLEKPLETLKFHFDGDLITGKSTPRELELEGGECIDVKIIS